MNNRIYIDINSELGKRSNIINNIIPYDINSFVNEHRKIGIDLCLAVSSKAKTYSIIQANAEILKISENNKYIIPIISLYPGIEYDISNIDEYLNFLSNSNAKGISLDMSKLFIFNSTLFEKIFNFANNTRLPIIVDWETIEDKNAFFEVIKRYDNLKVIVTNVNWSFKKYIFEYMKNNPNIYIGINGFIYQEMIEEVTKLFSSERLLFSSGYPYYDIGSVKAMIEYSNISEEDKDNIAYKNALNIFNLKQVKKLHYDLKDPVAETVDSGLKLNDNLNFDVIDAHTHYVSNDAQIVDWIGGGKSIDVLIDSAKKLGISKIITSPMDGLLYDGIIGNTDLKKIIESRNFPIYGYVTCNPYYDEDIEYAIKEIHNPKNLGLKLYPSKNWYPYDGKLYEEIINETANLNKYFLLHGTPEQAEKVLKKYPNLLVLLAHSTQSFEFMDKVINLLEKYPNLYIDICNRYAINKAIEYLVKNTDSSKIIFGSDSNLLSESSHLGWLAYSDIDYMDKKKILSDNIKKLVKRSVNNE